MNNIERNTDLIKCGFELNPQTNKWAHKDNKYGLPCTNAQFIDHESKYQYSKVKKLK